MGLADSLIETDLRAPPEREQPGSVERFPGRAVGL